MRPHVVTGVRYLLDPMKGRTTPVLVSHPKGLRHTLGLLAVLMVKICASAQPMAKQHKMHTCVARSGWW